MIPLVCRLLLHCSTVQCRTVPFIQPSLLHERTSLEVPLVVVGGDTALAEDRAAADNVDAGDDDKISDLTTADDVTSFLDVLVKSSTDDTPFLHGEDSSPQPLLRRRRNNSRVIPCRNRKAHGRSCPKGYVVQP